MFSDQITVAIAAAGKGRDRLDILNVIQIINKVSSRIIRLLSYIDSHNY